jgi:hypothetical protein
MTALSDDALLDIDAVVAQTGISARTWRRIIAAGAVGVCRISGSVRIPKSSLEMYLATHFTPPRVSRKDSTPRQLAEVIDAVLPRKRRAAR